MKSLFALKLRETLASLRTSCLCAGLAGGLIALSAPLLPAQSPMQIAAETNAKSAAAASSSAAATSATASQVVARVNGLPITSGQFEAETQKLMFQQLGPLGGNAQGLPPDQIQKLRNDSKDRAIQNLIDVSLLKQAKEKSAVKATDAEIEAGRNEMLAFIKNSGVTYEQFLASNGMTEADVTKALAERVEIKKMLEAKSGAPLDPTEKQEKDFYDLHKDEMNQPETVRSSHILIKFPGDPETKPPTDAEKAALRKKAEDVLAKVKAGGDFGALAKEYSDDSSKVQGGDVGVWPKGRMVKPYDDEAWSMKPGDVSGIVESQFGFHIIKVTEHNQGGMMKFEEVKDRIKTYLFKERFANAMTSLKEDLRKAAKIEILDKPAGDSASAPAMGASSDSSTMKGAPAVK